MSKRFLSDLEKEEARQKHLKGERPMDIARTFGCSCNLVLRYLKRIGVYKNRSSVQVHQWIEVSDEDKKIIQELHAAKTPMREIGRRIGVDRSVIRRVLIELGTPIRTNGEIKRVYWVDHHWLDKIDSPEKAIFLGLFFADGCNFMKQNKLYLSLHEDDKDYLFRVSRFVTDAPLKLARRMSTLYICSERLCKSCDRLGAVPAKSLIVKWPSNLPDHLNSYFVRGFFEGDGGFSRVKNKSKRGFVYHASFTSTKELLEKMNDIIFENLKIRGHVVKRSKKDDKNTYTLSFNSIVKVKILSDWLYKDYIEVAMERKYQKYLIASNIFEEAMSAPHGGQTRKRFKEIIELQNK